MSEHKTRKPFKKTTKRRNEQHPPIHPHIEQIQAEINLLQAELDELEANGTTDGDDTEKKIVKACLERYQNTLIKLTDSAIKDKLRIYHEDYIERDAKHRAENQILGLLHFFYIIRLAQFGLFSAIQVDNATDKLLAATDLSDQLIGSSVYATKDSNPKHRSLNRKSVFEILRKFETGSEERVMIENDVTFKQLKLLFDDIWNNTVDGQRALEKAKPNDSGWLFVPSHKRGSENGIARDIEAFRNSHFPTNQQNNQPKQQSKENVVKQNENQKGSQGKLLDERNNIDSMVENNENEIAEKDTLKKEDSAHETDSSKEQVPVQEEDHKPHSDELNQSDGHSNNTADIEKPTFKNQDELLQDEADQDLERKSVEIDPSADSWRRRPSDQFNGRSGRGSTTRGFKRGSGSGGRGRFTRPRGTRGAPRGRGRGYSRSEHTVTG